jgi:predicted ATPase
VVAYPTQALQHVDDARALAQQLTHLPSLTFAFQLTLLLHSLRREGRATQERAAATIALAQEHGFPLELAWGTMLHGWALAEQGQEEAGIAQLQQGLAAYRTIGAQSHHSHFLTLLAEAHGRSGQVDKGLATIAETLRLVEQNDERWYEAEVWRIKGELTLQQENQKAKGKSRNRSPKRSGSVFSESHRNCTTPTSQITRTACVHQLGPAVATTRQDRRSATDAG